MSRKSGHRFSDKDMRQSKVMPWNSGTTVGGAAVGGITVVIPTFNETESIGAVVTELPRDVVTRIVVVDGGSGDGTPERARAAGAEVIPVGRGYGLACLTGAQAAGADDIIVFMDGDGADDPCAIAALMAPSAGRVS